MITAVEVTRLKRFHHERFELDEVTLLAGPNNAGKSTVLQALALWRFALTFWNQRRAGTGARERTGVVLTRQQLPALPLREMSLLWEDRHIGRSQDTQIELRVHGDDDGGWECGIELQYANPESVYVRPLGARKDVDLSDFPPTAAATVQTVHVPALSGISPDEPRYDRAYQDLLIGSGNAGQVLRNLLLEVAAVPAAWEELVGAVDRLFRVELLAPQSQGLPYIVAEYRTGPGRKELDLANAGSGFLQVLLLLAFMYGRQGAVLLLDEPDAHLHVILQKEVFDLLRGVAGRRRAQLVIATHSEVLLDESEPQQVISFVTSEPRRLSHRTERDQLRESMKRISTTDLLAVRETGSILYLEDRSDERILSAFAEVLAHPARRVLRRPYTWPLKGNDLRRAREHFFALRGVEGAVRGLVLLDGDARGHAEQEGPPRVLHWRRYEVENYLLVPRAIAEVASWGSANLFSEASEQAVLRAFHREVPEGTDLFSSVAGLSRLKASTEFLPTLLEAAGRPLPKPDLFLIAQALRPEEVHPEVIEKLDAIAALAGPDA
jgi:predicted ATPase